MRKFLLFIALSLIICSLSATEIMNFRFGYLWPDKPESGIFGGIAYGTKFDQSVQIEFSGDFFFNSYTEKSKIGIDLTGNSEATIIQMTTDKQTYYFPLMANLIINIPVQTKIKPYAKGGIGYGFLWEDIYVAETDENPKKIDDVKFYGGFNWLIGGGAKFKLGNNSNLTGECFFNGGKMKRDKKQSSTGITWSEVNMSGIGLRLGVEIEI